MTEKMTYGGLPSLRIFMFLAISEVRARERDSAEGPLSEEPLCRLHTRNFIQVSFLGMPSRFAVFWDMAYTRNLSKTKPLCGDSTGSLVCKTERFTTLNEGLSDENLYESVRPCRGPWAALGKCSRGPGRPRWLEDFDCMFQQLPSPSASEWPNPDP